MIVGECSSKSSELSDVEGEGIGTDVAVETAGRPVAALEAVTGTADGFTVKVGSSAGASGRLPIHEVSDITAMTTPTTITNRPLVFFIHSYLLVLEQSDDPVREQIAQACTKEEHQSQIVQLVIWYFVT